jgi:hypothetical protein
LLPTYGRSTTKPPHGILGYIPLDDLQIWGQPNNHLSATLTLVNSSGAKLTLSSKFLPYFDTDLQRKWSKWLGDLAGQDPNTFSGPLRSWKDVLDFRKSTKLLGFGSGLTQLQFANTLALMNVVKIPPVIDVTQWISVPANCGLGAYWV